MDERCPGLATPGRGQRSRSARLAAGLVAVVTLAGITAAGSFEPVSATGTGGGVRQTTVVMATASTPALTSEQKLATRINNARKANHRRAYKVVLALSAVAEKQARRMASKQSLYHNPHLTTDVRVWVAIGENVAYASSVKAAHRLLMNSPPHRANLLSKTFTQMGLGVVRDGRGRYWVCEVFRKP